MNEFKTSCAADRRLVKWEGINRNKYGQSVKKLQARIVKVQKEGRHNKVKTLQWILIHLFYAKALAVKRVTSNQGRYTSLRCRPCIMVYTKHPSSLFMGTSCLFLF
jgi:RNA-directed DNA polymerase